MKLTGSAEEDGDDVLPSVLELVRKRNRKDAESCRDDSSAELPDEVIEPIANGSDERIGVP